MFKRKIYDKLLEWKNKYSTNYACLLEGARRVGKTTIAKYFASMNYKTYILIDFSNITKSMLSVFDDISNLDIFFLRLQAESNISLYENESCIIFDEVQLFPKARQAIKFLVKDGRYNYIETGSLISIKKNVSNILIPSEEMKINVYPMDYEEFCWATGTNYDILRRIYELKSPIGNQVNRKLMRDFRIYIAVGGMPQAVEAYVNGQNFQEIDHIKRQIISMYEDDFRKIDSFGRLSKLYNSVPAQLANNKIRFVITNALKKQRVTRSDEKLISELIDSKTVIPSYNVSDPSTLLSTNYNISNFKLYLSDVGLFVTIIFNNNSSSKDNLYSKLLSDNLDANLGYLYENAVAQIIASSDNKLFFHTWRDSSSTHSYEIDFLLMDKFKLIPIEVKSSKKENHKSLDEFSRKYSSKISRRILLSQGDISHDGMLELFPFYLTQIVINNI